MSASAAAGGRPAAEWSPTAPYRLLHLGVGAALRWVWRVSVDGLEHVPPSGGLVVAVNHRSWMDPPLAAHAVYRVRVPRFVGKEELFRLAPAGWFLRMIGVIPLDRARGDVGALRAALSVVEAGGCMVVFPEGTRSRTGAMGRPKPGVSFLAHRTGAPVVPARVRGTERFRSLARQGIRFGPPLRYEGDGGRDSYRLFAERVMEAISRL